jgi:hypothetical protein
VSVTRLEDAIRRIDGMMQDLRTLLPKIELYAATQARAIIERRVFNEGKAADGSDIGQYKGGKDAAYKKKRNAEGRRIDKVDLQFTGRLFESINVVQQNGKDKLAIVDPGAHSRAQIAAYLEEKYSKTIFAIGKDEKVILMKKVSKFAEREISKIIQKWSK